MFPNEPNDLLRDARMRVFGTQRALADAANRHLPAAYLLTANDIGKLERGVVRYPSLPRREALRTVLGVATDAEIGFGRSGGKTCPAVRADHDHRAAAPPRDDAGVRRAGSQTELMARVEHTISTATSMVIGDDAYRALVADLAEWAGSMRRREVLHWLARAAGSAAASLELFSGLDPDDRERTAGVLADPGRVDAVVVQHIDDILWRCMRQDDALGPQAALATVLAQRDLVRGLLGGASGPIRDELLGLFANLSRFAGWLSFDLNDYDAARGYYEVARTAAHEARNTELGILVLCNMSHLATWRGQPRVGIDHALAAQGWAAQTADRRLRAYAFDVAARAFAKDHRERDAVAALERGHAEIDEAEGESRWAYFFNAGQLESTRSACLLDLGRAEEAAAVAQSALGHIRSPFVRNLGIASTHLGLAHLNRPRPEVAAGAAALADAVRLAGHNRSTRLAQVLRSGLERLGHWAGEPEVRETLALAGSYGLA